MAGERLFASEVSVIIKDRNLIKQLRPYIEEKEERRRKKVGAGEMEKGI